MNKNHLFMILTFTFLINITFSLCFCLFLLYCYVSKCLYFQKSILCDFHLPTKCGIDFYLYKTVRMFAQYLCTGISDQYMTLDRTNMADSSQVYSC